MRKYGRNESIRNTALAGNGHPKSKIPLLSFTQLLNVPPDLLILKYITPLYNPEEQHQRESSYDNGLTGNQDLLRPLSPPSQPILNLN
jgi:hypothetical protein